MWSRARLKAEAKRILKIDYWLPFAVALVAGILGGGGGGSAGGAAGSNFSNAANNYNNGSTSFEQYFSSMGEEFQNLIGTELTIVAILIAFVILIVAFAASYAIYAFLSGPVLVGEKRFFMENRSFPSKFSRLFWAFGNGSYMNAVKIMFFMQLKIFLWSLLFIIPGFIKAYEYRMIPYIIAENPEISMDRAFELSKKMTDGDKWNIFVFDLSFIGWFFLGSLACGVGTLFVTPYYEATHAELYQVMREKAYALGFADNADLPGFMPQQYS